MKKQTKSTLYKIEGVRRKNNRLWCRLLRISLAAAPRETKAVLQDINQNDKMISSLLGTLCDE